MKRSLVLFPVLALVSTACGDSTPSGPDTRLTVTPASVTLLAPSDSVTLEVTLDGSPVESVQLTATGEAREVSQLPVLDPSALGRGVLLATGPGSVTVRVTAGSAGGSVTVRVAPVGPTVFASRRIRPTFGADTVLLLGSGLAGVPLQGAVRLGDEPVVLTSRSANALRFPAPVIEPDGCSGGAASAAVHLEGGVVASGLTAPVSRTGELHLAVGEWRILDPAQAACVRLPDTGGEYILAHADLRQVFQGRDGWAGFPGDPYAVTVEDRTLAGSPAGIVAGSVADSRPVSGWSSFSAGAAPLPEHSVRLETTAGSSCSDEDFTNLTFWCRSKPWQEGDRMRIREPGTPDTVWAEVWKVFPDGYVFAVVEGDDSQELREFKAAIEEAMPLVSQHALPLMRTVFGENTKPVTSAAAGQMLTIIGDFPAGFVGWGCCSEQGPWSAVILGSMWRGPVSQMVYLFTHEFVHTYQQRWFYDQRPEAGEKASSVIWGTEGGADLLAFEVVRRSAGVAWGANRPLISFQDGSDDAGPLITEMGAQGDLSAGYEHASSFLRDVVARLVQGGVAQDAAFREVALGSLEDWYGFDYHGLKRTGFTERVRALAGSEWDPGEALLLYTLSQGADDLTRIAALQNPFYFKVGLEPLGDGFGKLSLRAGEGGRLVVSRRATSTGLLRLLDGGTGASFQTSSDRPNTAWAVARIR